MTEAATHFVTPLPFQTISQRPVSIDPFQLLRDTDMAHISLSKKADLMVIAPATANTIAKLAHGLADNLLTSTVLATTAPLVIAPAMDADMWANVNTQRNIHRLEEQGTLFVGPGEGRLASGRRGRGRLVDTPTILGAIRMMLGREGILARRRMIITAGGTQEPLDPVRHLGNRSSGKMGYALATAARDAGAEVTLISAPTGLSVPYGIRCVAVRTAAEMKKAVIRAIPSMDALVMAAAVADYYPADQSEQKLKKGEGDLFLRLARTDDILATVAEHPARPEIVVGFAAETEDLLLNATLKLERKRLDLLVANDVSQADSGFQVDTNRVTLLSRDGGIEELALMTKAEVSEKIVQRIALILDGGHD